MSYQILFRNNKTSKCEIATMIFTEHGLKVFDRSAVCQFSLDRSSSDTIKTAIGYSNYRDRDLMVMRVNNRILIHSFFDRSFDCVIFIDK